MQLWDTYLMVNDCQQYQAHNQDLGMAGDVNLKEEIAP